jgi:outer membrane protein W
MKKSVLLTVMLVFTGLTLNAQAGSLNLKIGLFHPALESDLWQINMENLAFDKADMQGKYYALEYEYFVARNLSVSIEGGYYQQDHFTFYRDYEYDDGSEIPQNIALEIAGLELGFKFYPMGHRQRFFPYLGAGGGLYYWKYEQWGDIIDFENDVVYQDEYAETSTYTPGFNAKAGFVFRPSRSMGIAFEGRYQFLKGELSSFFEGFEKLDMSGFGFTIGFNLYMR